MFWRERIVCELRALADGDQRAELTRSEDGRDVVIYYDVPTAGARLDLPGMVDVLVPVPYGYPAMIDLAGLEAGSPLLPHLRGGTNLQGVITVGSRVFQLASYHPHSNGGGPPWDPSLHGFHTYFGEVLAWLAAVS
jgi:hypothetical protein